MVCQHGDRRGPLSIPLDYLDGEPCAGLHGDRIAQAPVVQARFATADGLAGSGRGEGGSGPKGRA